MPRKPGNLNPEGSGRGSMPALGRSSQSTSAAANKRAGAGAAAKQAQARTVARMAGKEASRRLAIINNPMLTITGKGGRQGAMNRLFEEWYKPAKMVGQITRAASRIKK